MRKKLNYVVVVFVAMALLLPTCVFAEESNADTIQNSGLFYYETYDNPGNGTWITEDDYYGMLNQRRLSRAWYSGDFDFSGTNYGASRSYDGNYMAVRVSVSAVGSTIGTGTTIYV